MEGGWIEADLPSMAGGKGKGKGLRDRRSRSSGLISRSYRSPVDHFLFGDGPQIATKVALCALACRTVSSVSFFDHRIGSKAEHATASVPAEAVVVAQPARIRAGKQKQRGVHRAPCVSIR